MGVILWPGTFSKPWHRSDDSEAAGPVDIAPVTVTPWEGVVHISGAFLVSRLNLKFLNETCSRYSVDLDVASQVVQVLADTQLIGSSENQLKRYSFLLLKLETEFKNVLNYLTDLLLCSGRGTELWSKFYNFRDRANTVWKLIAEADASVRTNNPHRDPDADPSPLPSTAAAGQSDNSTHEKVTTNLSIVNYLEQARPSLQRQKRSPTLLGVGLGLLGSYIFSQNFGEDKNLDALNQNILKHNKLLKVTNERIDILSHNVSVSINAIKNVLDKLVEAQNNEEIHFALLWNLDQLAASVAEIKNTFKSGELTLTLLEKGILVSDLLDLNSLKRILAEGRKSFPDMEFPLEINRYTVDHMVKILKIERVSHLKFLMIIPLSYSQNYRLFSLIPHPVQLDLSSLVIPEISNAIITNDVSYMTTDLENIYSILPNKHLLLQVEPVYRKDKRTCEWAGFNQNSSEMVELCNYKKIGQVSDTFVTETPQNRLVYFSKKNASFPRLP